MSNVKFYQFQGRCNKKHFHGPNLSLLGEYYVTEKKTRFLVSFKPYGYEFPLFVDFCILKKKSKDMLSCYINNVWN